ncbi:MAG TPA: GIY-YIG nuclease family protein [Fimbriimonas sp.]|nr:GIY-YIG nuclease family protein [Fimbriimonas sp.]
MNEKFRSHVDSLHGKFEALVNMPPVKPLSVRRSLELPGIYLLSEGSNHLYAGRTRKLGQRIRNHCLGGSKHNQAVFAFRLAREATGKIIADYAGDGRRAQLVQDPEFKAHFDSSKLRIQGMDLRYVEEHDPLSQALLEI